MKRRNNPKPRLSRDSRRNAHHPTRSRKPVIYVFCGGFTEALYLKGLVADLKSSGHCNAEVETKRKGHDPRRLVKDAKAKKRGIPEGDQIWVVFDRDEFRWYKEKKNEVQKDRCLRLAYSDPCFEMWLLLHYRAYESGDDRTGFQDRYRDKIDGYHSKKFTDLPKILSRVSDAERRAIKQRKQRQIEGAPDDCPSTSMYELTQAIRKAMEGSK